MKEEGKESAEKEGMKGESGKERSKGGERENEKGENEDRKR